MPKLFPDPFSIGDLAPPTESCLRGLHGDCSRNIGLADFIETGTFSRSSRDLRWEQLLPSLHPVRSYFAGHWRSFCPHCFKIDLLKLFGNDFMRVSALNVFPTGSAQPFP